MKTEVDRDLLDFCRVFVEHGPMIHASGKPVGQKKRKAALAILNRIEDGSATDAEQLWFAEMISRLSNARKEMKR